MNNLKTLTHPKGIRMCLHMNLKYSTGFLIASLIQAGIVMATEFLGISSLGAKLTAMQLITHIIVGQIIGYIILYIIRKSNAFSTTNTWAIGSITGFIAWLILLSINSAIGKVNAPWTQGFPTVLSTLIAFIVFGIIATYTIKRYGYKET
jgi:uncharacterized membrane protein YagU involved in acid resistance